MATDEQLVHRLRQILPGILQHTPVTLAYLYDSAAAGRLLPGSDVDIALVLCRAEGEPDLLPRERLNLEFAVEDALEQQGVRKPDVWVIDNMSLAFRGQVATRGLRLYSRDEVVRVEFETRTWKEYFDFEPVARMMGQALLEDVLKHGL